MRSVRFHRGRRHFAPIVQEADERLFLKVAQHRSPALDAILPRLSRSANYSRLWIGIAAALALAGGSRGRKAALRGLRAVALSSAMVNGPIKWMARRHRPEAGSLPSIRRLLRAPSSSSFPSGHTASAAAFATAAALELPAAAAPLGVVAAAVGFSRVYTGAHFPSDVVAGAAIGAGAAVASSRWSTSRMDDPPASERLPRERTVDLKKGAGVVIGVNPSAGSASSQDPTTALKQAFPEATIVEPGEDMDNALRNACGPGTVALVVAGGDGTINAAATIAQDCGIPLGVVPAGTLNHFAGDLGVLDISAGLEALKSGRVAHVEYGLIAGMPFLNTASFAAYSEFVDKRERLEPTIGKWPAALVSLASVLHRRAPVRVEIDGKAIEAWAVFIGNGRYEPSGMAPRKRVSLSGDGLDVRILAGGGRLTRLRSLFVSHARAEDVAAGFTSWRTDRIDVRSLAGPLRLARDGETFDGPEHFTVELAPKPLEVFVPTIATANESK